MSKNDYPPHIAGLILELKGAQIELDLLQKKFDEFVIELETRGSSPGHRVKSGEVPMDQPEIVVHSHGPERLGFEHYGEMLQVVEKMKSVVQKITALQHQGWNDKDLDYQNDRLD